MGPAGLRRLRGRRIARPSKGPCGPPRSARRAPYKRPKTYVAAPDLPHTATGKLIRRAVPEHLGRRGQPDAVRERRWLAMPFATINPATGKIERRSSPAHTREQVDALLGARRGRLRLTTGRRPTRERARHLLTAAELLEGEVPDVARILTTEMGKTFAAAKAEVSKCALGLRWFAEHAEELLADEPITTARQQLVRALPAARPRAGRHAVELPAVAGDPLRRAGPDGRATSACSSTRRTCRRRRWRSRTCSAGPACPTASSPTSSSSPRTSPG